MALLRNRGIYNGVLRSIFLLLLVRNKQTACSFGWWPVLVCAERKVRTGAKAAAEEHASWSVSRGNSCEFQQHNDDDDDDDDDAAALKY
jgi:hypothetical protein